MTLPQKKHYRVRVPSHNVSIDEALPAGHSGELASLAAAERLAAHPAVRTMHEMITKNVIPSESPSVLRNNEHKVDHAIRREAAKIAAKDTVARLGDITASGMAELQAQATRDRKELARSAQIWAPATSEPELLDLEARHINARIKLKRGQLEALQGLREAESAAVEASTIAAAPPAVLATLPTPADLVDGPRPVIRRRRANLSEHARETMRTWLRAHLSNPYPTEGEKAQLASKAGIDKAQVSNWFINARVREVAKLKRQSATRR